MLGALGRAMGEVGPLTLPRVIGASNTISFKKPLTVKKPAVSAIGANNKIGPAK